MDINEKLSIRQEKTRAWALGGNYEYNANDKALIAEVKRFHGAKERKATRPTWWYVKMGKVFGRLNKGCTPWNKGRNKDLTLQN